MYQPLFLIGFWLVFFSGCVKNSPDSENDSLTQLPSQRLTYLALGDSYTIGESVPLLQNYPNQLRDSLLKQNVDLDTTLIIARTGWTTTDLKIAIDGHAAKGDTFSLVTLLIGVNNQFRGMPFNVYEKEFEELVNIAIAFANGDEGRIIVVSIPDYGYTPFGSNRDPEKISQELDEYNAYAKAVAERYNITFVDITPITREGLDDPALVASDDLHPSVKAYSRFVKQLMPKAKMILQN